MGKTFQTTLLIRGDSKNAVRQVQLTRSELEKLTGAQSKNVPISERMGQSFLRANTSVDRLSRGLQGFGGLLTTLGIGAFVRKTVASADSLASMRGELNLVTDSQEELNQVYARALDLSNRTGQATEATVSLYARMARSTEELGLTQDELFKITQAVNQSFVVSGASATEAGSATLQLSQGLAAGALRGEELNSVMENSPRLARALADGLGVSIGQLREMGKAGELTAEAVTTALLGMAGEIEGEFQEMPVTVGRLMQSLKNNVNDALGQVDTGPLQSAIQDAQNLIADPGFKESVQGVAAALLNLIGNFGKAVSEGQKFAKWLGEELAAQLNGIAADDLPRLEQELALMQKQTTGWRRKLHELGGTADEVDQKIIELTAAIAEARERQQESAVSTQRLDEAQRQAAEAALRLKEEQQGLNEVLLEGGVNVRIANAAYAEVAETWKENDALMKEIVATAKEQEKAMKALGERADPVAAAIERGGERMDDALAGFFKNMLRDGKVSFDSLKDLALDTLGEIIYAFARNRVLLSVGAGGGSAGALAGTGTAGGGLGGIGSSLLGSVGNFGAGLYNTIGDAASFLADLGLPGFDSLSVASYGKGLTTTGLGSLATAGAGIAGGFLGNQVFGPTSGIGSTIGGIGGSIFGGPIGAAVGSFLGSGLESLLGGKPSDKTGTALLDLTSGEFDIGGLTGSKFSQENRDVAGDFAQLFGAFAQSVGGASGSLDIGVGSRDGLRLDGRDFGDDIDGFLEAGFDKILDSAENLSPALRNIIDNFDGTAEETVQFAASMADLNRSLDVNAVEMAEQAYRDLQDGATGSVAVYRRSADSLRELIQNFDGSADSAGQLNQALAINRDMAFQLAAALLQASDQVGSLGEESAQYFRESVMSESELRAARIGQRDELKQQLRQLTDPEALLSTFSEFEALQRQLFDSLSPEQQARQAENYASVIENETQRLQDSLAQRRAEISAEQDQINADLGAALSEGAAQMNQAATQINAAVGNFGAWVQQLTSQGINLNLPEPQGSETVA